MKPTACKPSQMGDTCEAAVTSGLDQSVHDCEEEETEEAGSTTDSRESQDFGGSEHKSANKLKQKHNKKEKMRRQGLKDSVYSLRNQLKIHGTKRATTISVLKAARIEIHDLKSNELKQKEELSKLKGHHYELLQKIKQLRNIPSPPQDIRPAERLTPNMPPALIKLPPNALPPVLLSTIPPYQSQPFLLPLPYLPGLPYLPSTAGYHSIIPLSLLTNPLTNQQPLHLYSNPYPYMAATIPAGTRLNLTPDYSRVGEALRHEALMATSLCEAGQGGRSSSPGGEEVMVDIEGDGDEPQSCKLGVDSFNKHERTESELKAAVQQQSGRAGKRHYPHCQLPPSPPPLTSSGTNLDIILVTNITDKLRPAREQFLHQATAYAFDKLSKTFSSEDGLVITSGSCTKHTEKPHPIFMEHAQFPSTYSYELS